jgi:hypothetical protein
LIANLKKKLIQENWVITDHRARGPKIRTPHTRITGFMQIRGVNSAVRNNITKFDPHTKERMGSPNFQPPSKNSDPFPQMGGQNFQFLQIFGSFNGELQFLNRILSGGRDSIFSIRIKKFQRLPSQNDV